MNDRTFRDVVAPPAPRELRARVLAACRVAESEPARQWIDRAWESSSLRLAWATLVLALLIGVLAVEGRAPAVIGPAPYQTSGKAPESLFGVALTERSLGFYSTNERFLSDL